MERQLMDRGLVSPRRAALVGALAAPLFAMPRAAKAAYAPVTAPSLGVPVLDDPTNTSGLGAPAILRGRVSARLALQAAGGVIGSGQTTSVQQANLAALQAALNYAGSAGKWFEIEPDTYEIYGSAGLVVPIGATGFTWRGHLNSVIRQFATNAPVLTIGDTTGNTYAGSQDISGFTVDYGVSQAGQTNANALLLGALAFSTVEKFNSCVYYGSNPPYIALKIACSGGSENFFFQNVIRDGNLGGAQQNLFALLIGSTGNLFSNIYSHNGSSSSTRNATAGPAWLLTPSTQGSDDVFERCNIEHVNCTNIISLNDVLSCLFIGLHIEDVQLTGAYPTAFNFVGAQAKFVNTFLLDLLVASSATNVLALVNPSGYGEVARFEGLRFKWSSYDSAGLAKAFPLVAPPNFNGNDSTPNIKFYDVSFEDDAGNNLSNLSLAANSPGTLTNNNSIDEFVWDNLLPSTKRFQATISAAYSHYGMHEDAILYVPASITSFTLTLQTKRHPSGTGSTLLTKVGSTVRIRRLSGTVSGTLTIADSTAGTITTNATSGTDLIFAFTGTAWVAAA